MRTPPLKVLLMPHRFAPLGVGGVERWAWTLAEALVVEGVEAAVLTRDDRDARALPPFSVVQGYPAGLPEAARPRGVDVHWIVHRHRDARRSRDAWSDRRFVAPIDAVLDLVGPDVVHVAHVDGWGVVPFRRAARRGLIVGTTLHDYKAFCARGQLLPETGAACEAAYEERCVRCVAGQMSRGPLRAWLGRALPEEAHALRLEHPRPLDGRRDPGPAARAVWRARQAALLAAVEGCDVVSSPSEFVAEAHRRAGLDRPIEIIRNAPAGTLVAPTPRAAGPLRVGFFGTDVSSKGLDLLVRAVVAADTGTVELHVHGPRPGTQATPIHWHGPYAPDEALARMAAVDVVALPSRWPENAPLVAAEARLAGRPLLVSDVGGLPEGVRDGIDGWVLACDDIGAWAGAIGRLAHHPDRLLPATTILPAPPTPADMARSYIASWGRALADRRGDARRQVDAPLPGS